MMGVALSGLQEAARYQGRSPQVAYLVNKVHVFFARSAGGGFWIPACAIKDGADFSVDDIAKASVCSPSYLI
jgi:stringent starvation protein B